MLSEDSFEISGDHPCRLGRYLPYVLGCGMRGVFRSLDASRMDRVGRRRSRIDGNIIVGAGRRAGRDDNSGEAARMGLDRETATQTPLN
jgi:hypothetical protein